MINLSVLVKTLFCNILYMSGMASMVAIIILLLRKIFDKKISPQWKFAMWALLLISLIIPFRMTRYSSNESFYTFSSFIDVLEKAKNILLVNSYGKILASIWGIGIAILTIMYLVNSLIMKRKIGKEEITDERILKILKEAKELIGVKKEIKLIKQNHKITPCIYGSIHPKILLTEEILQKSDEVLKHILMHELSHYKRKDILLNKLLLLISIIYWFNPIVWICFQQVRQDMELKADELTLSKLPKQKEKEYAKSLVSILPISQNEKVTTRLLYVTDGKKNMERRIKMIKLSDKFKEYKTLIGITTLTLTLCIGLLIFTQVKPKEEENYNNIKYFEIPDRIVYKIKDEDKYYVYTSASSDYDDLVNQLIKCIDGVGEGARLSQDDMKKIEQEENYIELDYDTISKNYVITYQKENYNVIKRTDEGGVVVKNNIKQKEKLEKMLAEQIQNKKECYSMLDTKEYRVLEPISYQVPTWSNELKKYEQGIYSVRLGSKDAWEKFKTNNKITLSQEIPKEQFEKTNVIATITKYQIDRIETRVGGMTLYFNGTENKDKYYVNLYCISKAVNINCIYRNFNETRKETRNIKGEELKNELLSQKEIPAQIKQIENGKNNITLTCQITDYYNTDYQNQETFDITILVDKQTQIFSRTDNQLEELQKMQERGDTIFVTFREEEKQKGKLVADNIEVMGC